MHRIRLTLVGVLSATLVAALAPGVAGAATITVTATSDDAVDNGVCTLREAIGNANTDSDATSIDCNFDETQPFGDDTINLVADTYVLDEPGPDDNANGIGDLDVNTTGAANSLTIDGAGAATTIDPAPAWDDRVLHHFAGTGTLTVSDLTLTGGRSPSGSDGGGILGQGLAAVRTERAVLTDNRAGAGAAGNPGAHGGNGGAVFATLVTAVDSLFSANLAGDGGAGTAGGAGGQGGAGGAIATGGPISVTRSTLSGNVAGSGGDGNGAGPGGFSGNGGAIACLGCDGVVVRDSLLVDNLAGDAGFGASLLPRNGGSGGGLFGTATVINSTIVGNSAGDTPTVGDGGDGGGLAGGAALISSTVTANAVGSGLSPADEGLGGGVFASNTDVANSIVADNVGPDCGGVINDQLHNLGDDPSCPPGFLDNPPGLDPLGQQFNGGPTETIALVAGSAAIDAVPTAACVDNLITMTPLSSDQRGSGRPSGSACDIGAYEVQQASPPISTPTPPATKKKKCKKKKGKKAGAAAKKKCKKKKKKGR